MTFRFACVVLAMAVGTAFFDFCDTSLVQAQIKSLKAGRKNAPATSNGEQLNSVLKRTSAIEEVPTNEQQIGPTPIHLRVLEDFRMAHPRARIAGAQFGTANGPDAEDKSATRIFGTTLAVGVTPIDSARNLVDEISPALGIDIGHLVPAIQRNGDFVVGAMTNPSTGEPKLYAFRLEQHYNGVPVFRSGAGFVTRNEPGNPVVMSNFDVKEFADVEIPAVGPETRRITAAMKERVQEFFDSNRTVKEGEEPDASLQINYSEQELVIYAGIYNFPREPELAMVFMAERGSVQTWPDYQKYLVVASVESGNILHAETQIHNVDVNGNVAGRATLTNRAAVCDPETQVNLPYAEVSVIGGNTSFTDINGNFTIPHGGSTNVTVRSRLYGTYFEVFDQSNGGAVPTLTTNVTPPGPANFLHNPNSASETNTANVNAYYHSNIVRDWVVQFEPSFPVIANQTGFNVNTNINDSCNAFYNGSSINFFTSGSGCNNTAFADVVYHEYGHHIVNVTNNGQDQFGEGSGDCCGVILEDEPILGNGFTGNCNAGIRNADNSIQYPCTNNGSGHFCGQLLSGCVWDTMQELMVTEPTSYQAISAQLFLGMTIIRGQLEPFNGTVEPSIAEMYLVIDDDDADVFNGTPHYDEIDAGFSAHNMDPPDIDTINFAFPSGRPEFVSPAGGVAFTVEVEPVSGNPQPGSGTLYVDSGSGFQSYAMNEISSNVYEVDFPATDCGTVLRYYFSASDDQSNLQFSPRSAPDITYTAISGILVNTPFEDNFETSTGWTGSGDATDGQWSIGIPVGGGDRGDPPTDGDGSGRCLLTDNVDGNSDVDGGSTIATTPVFDASTGSGEEAIISYYRWYSNDAGDNAQADIFEVEVSNNGGSTWTNLETVGPTGPEAQGGWIFQQFNLGDVISLTNQMQVRFIASDLGGGSVVEAAVDGFKVQIVGCVVSVTPSTVSAITGQITNGNAGDLSESDDSHVEGQSAIGQRRMQFKCEMEAVSAYPNPSEMSFTIESSFVAQRLKITQQIEMFNFDSQTWELVEDEMISFTDSSTTVDLTGDLSRFVENGTNAMKCRTVYFQPPIGLLKRVTPQFKVLIDQAEWTITP